jgi:acetylornithine/succinyldiaminopimelate/putrescine aminotransferase
MKAFEPISPPDASVALRRFPPGAPRGNVRGMGTAREEAQERFAAHVSRGKVEFYRRAGLDVVMGRREGGRFWDAYDTSRWWWNCHSNGGVFNLGHRHPGVISAVRCALEEVDLGNHHLVSARRAALAERLAATTGNELWGVVFGVSGGEAVDLALKLARGVTSRRRIVSAQGAYHGHTGLALATGDAEYRHPFGPNLPDFVQVPFDDLAAMERAIDDDTAAVILETIPATLGMPIPSPGYLPGVERLCRARGARLVLDEVQTGLGRTGRIWAYQHEDVRPDAIVCGKGLSGGIYPITATLMTREMHAFFDRHPFVHFSTFGGSEIGCAAALAVLDAMEAPGFLERVCSLSDRFDQSLRGLPFEIRRRGLMMGLRFHVESGGMFAAKACYDAGVFALYANNDKSVLQFLPPLILSDDEADDIAARVRRIFA